MRPTGERRATSASSTPCQLTPVTLNAVAIAAAAQVGQSGEIEAVRTAAAAIPIPRKASSVAGATKREASRPQPMRAGTATTMALAKTCPARSRS